MDGGHYRTTRTVRPSDREKWTEVTEIAPAVCAACESKGMTSARCRSGSKGEVPGRKQPKTAAPQFSKHVNVALAVASLLYRLLRYNMPAPGPLVDTLSKGEQHASTVFGKATP